MRDLKSKLAREVNRLTGWRGTVFDRRYESAVATDQEGAQIERLVYILGNGVKEGLVERPQDWPGVHCVNALLAGAHLPSEVYRTRIQTLVDSIIQDAALARSSTGRSVEGVESILSRDPQYRPAKLARSPAPLVHAATKAARNSPGARYQRAPAGWAVPPLYIKESPNCDSWMLSRFFLSTHLNL
jgi:hypothetical protein